MFLPEDSRIVNEDHHIASSFAARLTREELDGVPRPAPRTAAFPAPSSDAGTRDFSHPKYM